MGAGLAHLLIINCNINKKELHGLHVPFDYTQTDPQVKADAVLPYSKLLNETHWSKEDTIVRIINVPKVMQPHGFILSEHDKDLNQVTLVTKMTNDEHEIEKFVLINKESNQTVSYLLGEFTIINEDKKEDMPDIIDDNLVDPTIFCDHEKEKFEDDANPNDPSIAI
jgi:hypothetical protein